MIAELIELNYFKNIDVGVLLIEGIMKGYGSLHGGKYGMKEFTLRVCGAGWTVAFRTAVHVGIHLICSGSRVRGWATEEQIRKVVELGRDFVINGWMEDTAFFEETALKCIFD